MTLTVKRKGIYVYIFAPMHIGGKKISKSRFFSTDNLLILGLGSDIVSPSPHFLTQCPPPPPAQIPTPSAHPSLPGTLQPLSCCSRRAEWL